MTNLVGVLCVAACPVLQREAVRDGPEQRPARVSVPAAGGATADPLCRARHGARGTPLAQPLPARPPLVSLPRASGKPVSGSNPSHVVAGWNCTGSPTMSGPRAKPFLKKQRTRN